MEHDNREKTDILVDEAKSGRLDRVKFYLEEENIDVDSTNSDGLTSLHIASRKGHIEIVRYLISRGANVNIIGGWPSVTPLMLAATGGHVEIAKKLIKSGAKTDIVLNGWNLLTTALMSEDREMLSFVISLGFDINQRENYKGMTPLAYAMELEADRSVEFLLENGADYKKTTEHGFLPTNEGFSGFPDGTRHIEILLKHIEEKEGREGMVDYINCNDNSKGFTALHQACSMVRYDGVKLLLECGADTNIRDKKGRKPYELLYSGRLLHYQNDVLKQVEGLFESYKRQRKRSNYFWKERTLT